MKLSNFISTASRATRFNHKKQSIFFHNYFFVSHSTSWCYMWEYCVAFNIVLTTSITRGSLSRTHSLLSFLASKLLPFPFNPAHYLPFLLTHTHTHTHTHTAIWLFSAKRTFLIQTRVMKQNYNVPSNSISPGSLPIFPTRYLWSS